MNALLDRTRLTSILAILAVAGLIVAVPFGTDAISTYAEAVLKVGLGLLGVAGVGEVRRRSQADKNDLLNKGATYDVTS